MTNGFRRIADVTGSVVGSPWAFTATIALTTYRRFPFCDGAGKHHMHQTAAGHCKVSAAGDACRQQATG